MGFVLFPLATRPRSQRRGYCWVLAPEFWVLHFCFPEERAEFFGLLPLLKNLPSLIFPGLDEVHEKVRRASIHHHGALGAGVEPFGENLEPFLGGLARLASDKNRDVQGAVLSGYY